MKWSVRAVLIGLTVGFQTQSLHAETDYQRALKRAQYLLNGTVPTDADFNANAGDQGAYNGAIRNFVDDSNFYDIMMRYHERLFGVGLPTNYIDELMRDDIDNKVNKFASILCNNDREDDRLKCVWKSSLEGSKVSSCPRSWEQATSIFWYPGIVAWVCPSVLQACGTDLSRCFIEYQNPWEARNSELGTTEAFDSRFSVIKSLSKQSAGLATAVVVGNYPYTKILEPGLTAVDGAIAHFYRQQHHFDLGKLNLAQSLLDIVDTIELTDTRFRLVNTGTTYEQGGILTTFGWLRRYEKNRTRANQTYERLLCRQFTSEPPQVFPQDPGNLRTTPGCEGCHSVLDPLADFFKAWGEGGDLYAGHGDLVDTYFGGSSGTSVADLANIIRNDNAFATCTVERVWEWLMGRKFYADEADIRAALTRYFVTTTFSFKELTYAVATHPAFTEGARSDSFVIDPLAYPPLGEPPGGNADLPECDTPIDFATDIEPDIGRCTSCHGAGSSTGREPLATEQQWRDLADISISLMTSGDMPRPSTGPPFSGPAFEFKEKVRCWTERGFQ